ncbi:5-methyltetrahydropteroyltriglutamate--homocysteine S-methyltransferase [Litorihabitans aurantiacus]|uniref:5-methyltetrahydropteroyltriglutamate--homocysteine S-methyltransferase n=1 Tax=Litorihabitans aurantiacus TaxID=1930061 RepID=A0AA37XHS6_9MICO|nr:5-methyltetrahydropteroyltriglutamate--homocysteine S-methyltransferase [Litorihabitans aurantiacus]GMA33351.1 5-methyltetrahydropteroyltriglutamate--homocysteine methyltransferase [Litorihabitans aurantiacus]
MTSSATHAPAHPTASILGYPRIGPRRELKKAVESHWAGRTTLGELETSAAALRRRTLERLRELGLGAEDSAIPLDFSYYDQVHDATLALGIVPERFADVRAADGSIDLTGSFTLARGEGERVPLEMTKWLDSNYHYLVPEIGPDTAIGYAGSRRVAEVREAAALGVVGRPVVVGPVSLLLLAKAADGAPEGFSPLDRLDEVVEAYVALLADLRAAGAAWVQLDEPALTSDTWAASPAQVRGAVARAYGVLTTAEVATGGRPAIAVAAGYGALGDAIDPLLAAGVEAIALDLVKGEVPAASAPDGATRDFSRVALLGGVVDGHNVWATDLDRAAARLEELRALGAASTGVTTSTSLFHVPHTVADEAGNPELPAQVASWLAFADEKVGEVLALAAGPEVATAAFARSREVAADRAAAPGVRRAEVRDRTGSLAPSSFSREEYGVRRAAQEAVLDLPALPTTTIGSFPQTGELRRARAALRAGTLSDGEYTSAMREEVARVIALQEELGLDVLVHGEPERNDMVQYFAENLDGFAVTQHGWVQSYGSRCARPSILWGDVSRPAPITVPWATYASSLTTAPVKGMLTGPVTILAWSFVRDDQGLGETANQVALALRDEIADLEAAGIGIIQVDEPALRELLPLRRADHAAYLDWSVASFRLATSGVAAETQIHTHLCYSEFEEVFDAIDGLDADVTSIEAARSRMEILPAVAAAGFERGIGPGVYDIHSPRVPSQTEVAELLRGALGSVGERTLWVNPDCGLKTRGYEETTTSLRHLVAAAREVRAGLA